MLNILKVELISAERVFFFMAENDNAGNLYRIKNLKNKKVE